MKTLIKKLTIAAAMLGISTAASFATETNDGEHKFKKAEAYFEQCPTAEEGKFDEILEHVRAFDMEIMAETLNDPEKLMALTVAVNDPHTMVVMAKCATEPVMWDTWMRNGTDFNKMINASMKLMNPEGMMKWMVAPVNPKIWGAALEHLNPETYVKWGNSMVSAEFYSPVTDMLSLDWYEPRLAWFAKYESYEPMVNMFTAFAEPYNALTEKPKTSTE